MSLIKHTNNWRIQERKKPRKTEKKEKKERKKKGNNFH